jgi:hypothetical protein
MTALHMGGIPELSMALGPILLIAVFVWIARKEAAEDSDDDFDDNCDDDCGDQSRPSSADKASASSCQSVSIENTGPRAR